MPSHDTSVLKPVITRGNFNVLVDIKTAETFYLFAKQDINSLYNHELLDYILSIKNESLSPVSPDVFQQINVKYGIQSVLNIDDTQTSSSFRSSSSIEDVTDVKLNDYFSVSIAMTIKMLLSATFSDFSVYKAKVLEFNNSVACGLVWTRNYYAYRCRTCAISNCMSLCETCFKAGNHVGHDFNMFRSTSGGACDCGDDMVMKASGFCGKHGEANVHFQKSPNPDLLATANCIIPRLLFCLIMRFRDCYGQFSGSINSKNYLEPVQWLFQLLAELQELGACMLQTLANAMTDTKIYQSWVVDYHNRNIYRLPGYDQFFDKLKSNFDKAAESLPTCLERGRGYIEAIDDSINHECFLDELTFWMIRLEFPQPMISLLLCMLPVKEYKLSFANSFGRHYSRIAHILANNQIDSSQLTSYQGNLSNRVVHISVQLLSNEQLSTEMCHRHQLLHLILLSLEELFVRTQKFPTTPLAIDSPIMVQHKYWPLIGDLINLLVHKNLAIYFLREKGLLRYFLKLIGNLQSVNLNVRQVSRHVGSESDLYYSSFGAEIEISANIMWTLWLTTRDHAPDIALSTMQQILNSFSDSLPYRLSDQENQLSFHLPLHRYLSSFLRLSLEQSSNTEVRDMLFRRFTDLNQCYFLPLRALVGFFEIFADLWVWNGLHMKGQAMTYAQSHFCNSLIDLDVFLVQYCFAQSVDKSAIVKQYFESFHVLPSLTLLASQQSHAFINDQEKAKSMVESSLLCLIWLLCLRTVPLTADEEYAALRRELAACICVEDRSHSQVTESLPDRESGHHLSRQSQIIDLLAEMSDLTRSKTDHLAVPVYRPKERTWLEDYDPIYTSLRCVYRKHHQSGMDRYIDYLITNKLATKDQQMWPPYRLPESSFPSYITGLIGLLHNRYLHAVIFILLYKIFKGHTLRTNTMPLVVFLLELGLVCPSTATVTVDDSNHEDSEAFTDTNLECWFPCDDLAKNLSHIVTSVRVSAIRGDLVVLPIHESIISLLFKIHQQQLQSSVALTSVDQLFKVVRDSRKSRVGDASHFVKRVLGLAAQANSSNLSLLSSLLPGDSDFNVPISDYLADDKHTAYQKRNTERRAKLMAKMAAQQRAFASNFNVNTSNVVELTDDPMDGTNGDEFVECCICNTGGNSADVEKPFALLALSQPTSLIAHMRSEDARLVSLFDKHGLSDDCKELKLGVLISNCSHFVHLECLQPLITASDGDRLSCPLCREKSNLVLPLCPRVAWEDAPLSISDIGRSEEHSSLLETKVTSQTDSCSALANSVQTACGTLLSDVQTWSPVQTPKTKEERWSFWVTTLVTNLNLELVVLRSKLSGIQELYSRRSSSGLLLRFLMQKSTYELDSGQPCENNLIDSFKEDLMSANCDQDVDSRPFSPLLLQNSIKILSLLTLASVRSKQDWFVALASVYNLAYTQALLQVALQFSHSERNAWASKVSDKSLFKHLKSLLSHANDFFVISSSTKGPQLGEEEHIFTVSCVETMIEERLNPFLRFALLLRCHLSGDVTSNYNLLRQPNNFQQLVSVLGLSDNNGFPSPSETFTEILKSFDALTAGWSKQLLSDWNRSRFLPLSRLRLQPLDEVHSAPRLIDLPHDYDTIFSQYRSASCTRCGSVPQTPAVCLVCQTFCCFHSACCTSDSTPPQGECHSHAIDCGSGIGLFLLVNSSCIMLFQYARATNWGSVYLDEFGEEDRDLRRGRPLYLSKERYDLLTVQWLLHHYPTTSNRPWYVSQNL